MEKARKRLDGRENVAPSPFIRIADSEARTVPFFRSRFKTRRKGNYSLLYSILSSSSELELSAQLRATGRTHGEAKSMKFRIVEVTFFIL